MPLTPFHCAECDADFSRFRTLSQIPDGAPCPFCGKPAPSQATAKAQMPDTQANGPEPS